MLLLRRQPPHPHPCCDCDCCDCCGCGCGFTAHTEVNSIRSHSRSKSPTRRTRVVEVTRSIIEEEEEDDEDGEACCRSCRPCACSCPVGRSVPPAPIPAPAAPSISIGNGNRDDSSTNTNNGVVLDALEALADAAFAACERSVPSSPQSCRVGVAMLCPGGAIVAGHAPSLSVSALRAALTEALRRGEQGNGGGAGVTSVQMTCTVRPTRR